MAVVKDGLEEFERLETENRETDITMVAIVEESKEETPEQSAVEPAFDLI